MKIIDFGLSKKTQGTKGVMHTLAGTPYFIPPEVLNEKYGNECDIWSLGVVLYMMMTGLHPFEGDTRPEVFEKIHRGDFTFPEYSN